jgi:hypothetical protein
MGTYAFGIADDTEDGPVTDVNWALECEVRAREMGLTVKATDGNEFYAQGWPMIYLTGTESQVLEFVNTVLFRNPPGIGHDVPEYTIEDVRGNRVDELADLIPGWNHIVG